jgi:hypothetical protein
MTARAKWTVAVVLVISAVWSVVVTVKIAIPFVQGISHFHEIYARAKRGRHYLLYEADCNEVLAACRELLARVDAGKLKPGHYRVFWRDPDPESTSFPQAILDLEPALVRMMNGSCLSMELCPGPDWYGVVAFAEGVDGSDDVKPIDGLYYHDADYREEYPDRMKWIDSAVEEGRRAKAARARKGDAQKATGPTP